MSKGYLFLLNKGIRKGYLFCQNGIQRVRGWTLGWRPPPYRTLWSIPIPGGYISLNILTKTLLGCSRPSCTNAVCFLDWRWEFVGTSVIGNCWNQQPKKLTTFQLHFSNKDCIKHGLRKLMLCFLKHVYKSGFMKTGLKETPRRCRRYSKTI